MTAARASRLLSVLSVTGILAVALGAMGCAGASASVRSQAFDVRGSVQVADAEPRVLTEGPVRLLHVDVEGKRDISFFRVPRRPGTDVDCRQRGVAIDAGGLARTGTSRLDLNVAANEGVCFTAGSAPSGSRETRVSWHTRGQKAASIPAEIQVAKLNLRGGQ